MSARESFAAVLSDPLHLLWVKDLGGNDIYIGTRKFADSGLGTWIGFYDWLRAPRGTIIGVRTSFLPDSGVKDFRKQLASNSCVEWQEGNFSVFFSTDHEYDSERSADQEFGFHRLLISSDGLLLLTYDVGLLPEEEFTDLMQRVDRLAMSSQG